MKLTKRKDGHYLFVKLNASELARMITQMELQIIEIESKPSP